MPYILYLNQENVLYAHFFIKNTSTMYNPTKIILFFYSFFLFTLLYCSSSFLYAHDIKNGASLGKHDFLSLPLLNFNARVKSFVLGKTQQGEIYIEIIPEGYFNAYQGRPYLREENIPTEKAASYVQNKPKKHFAFNLSLLEKNFSVSFKGHIEKVKNNIAVRLILPKEYSSFSILSSLAELQKLYTANPYLTLLFNILNYNVNGRDSKESSMPVFEGSILKKKPSSSIDPHQYKIQISFKDVQYILVIPYDSEKEEIEPIETFLNIWTKGADNFQVSPPNGYVYTKDEADNYVRYDLQFLNPAYNPETKELTFEGEFLQNAFTGKTETPPILEKENTFSSSFPCLVVVDWRTQNTK